MVPRSEERFSNDRNGKVFRKTDKCGYDTTSHGSISPVELDYYYYKGKIFFGLSQIEPQVVASTVWAEIHH